MLSQRSLILSVSGLIACRRDMHQLSSTTRTLTMRRYLLNTAMPRSCVSYLVIQIRTSIANALCIIAKYQWRPMYPSVDALLTACAESPDPLQIRYVPSSSASGVALNNHFHLDKGFSPIVYKRSLMICPNGRANGSPHLEFRSHGWVITH